MKKILGKVFSIFTVFLMVMSITTVNVFAETSLQDGLEVITITDKESYKDEDKAIVVLSIKNTNGYDMKDVEVNVSLPKQLSSSEKTTFNIPLLKANEIKEYKVIVERSDEKVTIKPSEDNLNDINSSVNTGDISPITGLIGIAGLSLFSILFLKKKNKLKKVMVLTIISSMVVGSFSVSSVNAQTSHPNTKEIKLTQNVKFGNNTYPLDILVRYTIENGEVVDEGEVTREQWITKLVDNLQLTSEFERYSFDDFDKANDASKIETAIQHGIIDLKANEDNMILFSPNDYATREFVAYTTAKALGFVDNGNRLESKDKDILNYPYEDYLSVHNGMFKLIDDYFKPTQYVSLKEIEVVIAKIKEIIDSTSIGTGENNKIEYQNNVKEFTTSYELDKENNRIITSDSDLAMLKVGDIAVLNNSDNINDSTAIKVESISNQNAQYMITYTTPSLDEVISDIQVEGKADNQNATFIPAENVTVDGDTPMSRAAVVGEIPFNKTLSLNLEVGKINTKIKVNFKEVQYRFNVNASLWKGLQINDAYLAVLLENDVSVSYKNEIEHKSFRKKLGDIKAPLGYGLNISAELYLVTSLEGHVEIVVETDLKYGFQLTNRNLRSVSFADTSVPSIELGAEAKMGIKPEIGIEWLGIDLASVSAEGGICADGTISNMNVDPFQFCLDTNLYMYSQLEARLGPNNLNLKFIKDIFTESNSPFKRKFHFEEVGKVAECTRGRSNYQGIVRQALAPFSAIHRAKIEIYKGNNLLDITYSGENGDFVGNKLNSGEYILRISANGYIPYEQKFEIIGGQTTYLEPQLMVDRNSQGNINFCSGRISNAYTGSGVADAKIVIKNINITSINENETTIYSDIDGNYSLNLKSGNYKIIVSKNGFITDIRYISINGENNNCNIALNPTELPSFDGMRIVLTWGIEPQDLDSHLVGSTRNNDYHIYYKNKLEDIGSLDVDDITSYGPETITLNNLESGNYKYYVHDFTNCNSDISNKLSKSGAQVKVYNGQILLYTFNIPANQGGTLWHVFDYNADTDQLIPVNEMSYEKDPDFVGGTYLFKNRKIDVRKEVN